MEPDFKKDYHYKAARKRVKDIKGFYTHLLVYLFVNIAILLMSTWEQGVFSGLQDIDNYYTPLFWGIGLAAHWASVFGSNLILGKDWEERKIQELMEKENRKKWE